ncbi:MAG: hypothetical protein LBU18_05665 [Treponema sp.]|jgi:hypothetical protein|nr:hypothetical protein [Treponema sp.]
MIKKVFLTSLLAFRLVSFPAAEEKYFVLVSPLVIDGLNADEARIIEALIYSYIKNLGEMLVRDDFPEWLDIKPALLEEQTPDYIFSGSVTQDADKLVLTLEIYKLGEGERVLFSSAYKSAGDLILNARSVVESAFTGRTPANGSGASTDAADGRAIPPDETESETITEYAVTGAWQGEPELAMIRLRRGGQGIAVFSSGAQMNLLYSIEDNVLKVTQNSHNTEAYYYRQEPSRPAIPYLAARRLTGEAKPMRWEFLLYENGTVLRGIKISSVIDYGLETAMKITHGKIQETEWIRTGR